MTKKNSTDKVKANPVLMRILSNPKIMEIGKKKRVGITSGLGAGKTHLKFQLHHYLCCENCEAKFSAIFYPTFDKIHSAGIPTYCKVLESLGLLENIHYRIVKSPYPKIIYSCLDGHEVHFLSAEMSPDRINAVEYSHATVDETGSLKNREIADNIHSRVRAGKSKYLLTVYGGVPTGLNFYADIFDSDNQAEDWHIIKSDYHRHKTKEIYRYKLSITDNPFIPKGYIDSLRELYGHDEALLRSYINGEFCARASNLACVNYLPHEHDGANIDADPRHPIYLTFDFNINPVAWTALQYLPYYDYNVKKYHWYAIDCSSGGYDGLQNSALEFTAKFPPEIFGNTDIYLYGDPSGFARSRQSTKSDFFFIKSTLRQLGFSNTITRATRAQIPESTSIDSINRLFFESLITICARCTNLKTSLLKTELITGTRKIDKKITGEKDVTGWFDSVKYFSFQCCYSDTGQKKEQLRGFNL